jgi:hypothetical protein
MMSFWTAAVAEAVRACRYTEFSSSRRSRQSKGQSSRRIWSGLKKGMNHDRDVRKMISEEAQRTILGSESRALSKIPNINFLDLYKGLERKRYSYPLWDAVSLFQPKKTQRWRSELGVDNLRQGLMTYLIDDQPIELSLLPDDLERAHEVRSAQSFGRDVEETELGVTGGEILSNL